MIAPEWSEHVSDRCVRNFWSCEACEYRVEDTIYFSLFGGTSMTDFRRSTNPRRSLPWHVAISLPWHVAIIDKPIGDKNHGFESC